MDDAQRAVEHRGRHGLGVTTFVLLVAYGVSALESTAFRDSVVGLAIPAALLTAALAALCIGVGVGVGVGAPLERTDSPGRLAASFVLQLAVLAAIVALFAAHGTFGMAWLYLMPIVAQSRVLLPRAGVVAVSGLGLALLGGHLWALGGWRAVPGSLLAVATAVVFVLYFTDVAVREREARAESQRLGDDLERANRRLGAYAVEAEELATERERARMAREIHDSVGHSLTAVHMQLEAARALLDREPLRAGDATRARAAVQKAQRCAHDGLHEIRRSVASLRADPLAGRDLPSALADLAADGPPAVDLTVEGAGRALPPRLELTLYRAAQEALTNVRKHARASRVDLRLRYPAEAEADPGIDTELVRLTVVDDGIGFTDRSDGPATDQAADGGGFGLLGLRERARQLGGRVTVDGRPGRGVQLVVELPLDLPAEARESRGVEHRESAA